MFLSAVLTVSVFCILQRSYAVIMLEHNSGKDRVQIKETNLEDHQLAVSLTVSPYIIRRIDMGFQRLKADEEILTSTDIKNYLIL